MEEADPQDPCVISPVLARRRDLEQRCRRELWPLRTGDACAAARGEGHPLYGRVFLSTLRGFPRPPATV